MNEKTGPVYGGVEEGSGDREQRGDEGKDKDLVEVKEESMLDKIEKLIVDGQINVLAKIVQVETNLSQRIDGVETNLSQRIDKVDNRINGLDNRIDKLDNKVETNATALYDLLKDVQDDVKKVGNKLDEHMKQPAHM